MKKTSIGGEALIEGIMMRGPDSYAIAIRKPDGEILVEKKPLKTLGNKYKIFKLPIIRGAIGVYDSMSLGMKSLMYSAEFVELDEAENNKTSKVDEFFNKVFGDKVQDVMMYISVILALVLSIGIFMLLPNVLAGFLDFNKNSVSGLIYYNLFEGVVRILLFFGYIVLISKMKDIQRVFEYHGAEHKTIFCYESEEELTVENVKKHSTRHPRCGTAFLFVVMIISILVFSFVGWHSVIVNILLRIILLPLVAGLSYEAIKYAGRSTSKLVKIINVPGLALQKFTTREPDDAQIEVAIAALNAVIVEDPSADQW